MRIRALAAASVMAFSMTAEAQAPAQKKARPTWRTAPTGYADGPVLPDGKWRVHDIARPKPRVVSPGDAPGAAPSDAIVLFDGKDLSQWTGPRGAAPGWNVENGYFIARSGSGTLITKEKFGDVQLHVEWAAPEVVNGDSQWRGNSGIIFMGRYEIQVLDSFNNPTYADGQAGAIYGQYPPLVNASRKPGEWQAYDMVFEAPRWEGPVLVKPARVTIFHNGVLLHNAKEFIGQMAHKVIKQYEPHDPEASLSIQDHDTPVRYRNIWIRRLKGYDEK
jgi:hypothetical protein